MGSGQRLPTEPVRAAATVILWRNAPQGAEVLMGQRGAAAVFMPSKFVFPGGAVDPGDGPEGGPEGVTLRPEAGYLADECVRRLTLLVPDPAPSPTALLAAARRELAEETGLILGPGLANPSLRFVFRAITPPGRSRRFDARFFLAKAEALQNDPEDFSAASAELSHLSWLTLAAARALDLPFITEVVLAEVAALAAGGDQPGVPFFDNSGPTPRFRRIV
ncbi:MAG: hypothetical protein B7Z10_04565 [Rhodobacterales bacterium 32-66-7]|nr:MAG: hypothetical protein B7Z10_04565 [Rhodobacterales bacterium 32-66-7]